MNLSGELDQSKIVKYPLPLNQYFQDVHRKTQIVIHHSAGWDDSRGMIDGWKADKRRVATAYGITDNGVLLEAFDPKHWASHIGYYFTDENGKVISGNSKAHNLWPETANRATNYSIECRTIGYEICNWGNLALRGGKYYSWVNAVVPESKVVRYENKFRGFEFFERYTDQELETLWKSIRHNCKEFSIPAKFDVSNFDLNVNAIKGVPGVYTHCNFHAEKVDCPPQEELIEMLKAL
mgnify:CR=1 FL=1